jgi:hypothetical protein
MGVVAGCSDMPALNSGYDYLGLRAVVGLPSTRFEMVVFEP